MSDLVNYHAEQSILGSILLKPELLDDCHLQPECFYSDQHQLIMEYMRHLVDIDKPIDHLLIQEYAGEDVYKLGGLSYLFELSESVPTTANFAYYQDIVYDLYVQRTADNTLRRMGDLRSEGGDVNEAITEAQEALDALSAVANRQENGFQRIGDMLDGHESKLYKRRAQVGLTGAPTASDELNKVTGGHQDGDLIIFAARPSMGKTAYVINDMIASAEAGYAVAIFSIEMKGEKISERAACAISNLDSNHVRTGNMSDQDWEKWTYARQRLKELPMYINDNPDITVQQIAADVKKLKKRHSRLVIYIDFLQLINPGKSFKQPAEAVKYVSQSLKRIARKNSVPVVAISAVGRTCETRQDKRPMLSDLRESGSIESDADIVVFLYRDDYYNRESEKKNIVELILAKGRDVGTGVFEMGFYMKTGKFLNLNRAKKAG